MKHLAPGESQVFTVRATNPWNTSGIELEAGRTYDIKVVSVSGWKDAWIATDPAGFESRFLTKFEFLRRYKPSPWLQLLGSVGRDDRTVFPIGWGTEITPETSGELHAFANDAVGFYWNNSGELRVEITRPDASG